MDSTGAVWLPEAASTVAGEVDALFYFIFYASLFFFVLVTSAMVYFAIRYRKRGKRVLTSSISHNTALEVTWTVIPTILVFVIFIWGFKDFLNLHVVPRGATEIKVTGQKWFWSFDYPEGLSVVNELTVPVNKPIKLLMASKDVIHSFYVPSFRVKMDVVPNRYSIIWFEATQTGEYNLFCTEFCGKGHSEMIGKVNVVTEEEYEDWLLENADPSEGLTMEEFGAKLYKSKACVTCHTIDGTASQGPSFLGIYGKNEQLTDGSSVLVDENYLRESFLNPAAKIVKGYQPVMPPYQGLLNDKEVDALIAYIKSLSQ
ncbi:MAG TPA: cytochrome c oxidase subunit II [Bacteroidetes bacterium]|nr:cytochrome c oxidase subunit II [Bacteroidota bacterium]